MHFLGISLLAILAGALLLARAKKDQPGKVFTFISWFFIVVGFLLFICAVAGGICRMKHRCMQGPPRFQREMMMKECNREMHKGRCCGEMMRGRCDREMCKDRCPKEFEVPAAVKQAFSAKFPAATGVEYGMEKNDFEVTFKENEIAMSANFDASGKWLETETEMEASGLPKEVTAAVGKNFAGFGISEVAKVETPDKGVIFEMDLKKGKEGFEVQFTPKGEILKKESLQEEEKD